MGGGQADGVLGIECFSQRANLLKVITWASIEADKYPHLFFKHAICTTVKQKTERMGIAALVSTLAAVTVMKTSHQCLVQ